MRDTVKALLKGIKLLVLDFDGVFTDNRVLVLEDGTEGVMCNRSDGLGVKMVKEIGIEVMVLSKEKNPVVGIRCKKLDIECVQGCDDKIAKLKIIALEKSVDFQNICYLGNDVNDICCLKEVGLPVVVADAYPEAAAHARYQTKKRGGHGAIRELCDMIISSHKKG